MSWLTKLNGFILRRSREEHELDEELRFDWERRVEANVAAGMTREEAEMAAKREFGGVDLAKEECRDERGARWLEDLWQDVRFGLRMLRKNPGFTAIAILTLALGIGANTAIFSVVNGVLLNPLPYPEPDQLVTLDQSKPNFSTGSVPYPNFQDWRRDNKSFSAMAAYRTYGYSMTGTGEAEAVKALFITSDYFPMLGVSPVMGRSFTPNEDVIGAGNAVMITEGLWKRKFGSSQNVLGRIVTLDGKDYVIVGVVPASFAPPTRNSLKPEIFAPLAEWTNPSFTDGSRSAGLGIHAIGRLKPGVTIEQARADMDAISKNLTEAFPTTNKNTGASVRPLRTVMLGSVRPFLLLLLGAVGFVLLIACVNVANLSLARSTARGREFAIRTALGARRGRVLRQLLTESVVLAIAGGGLGLVFAKWCTQAALEALPQALPRAGEVRLDARVLLFTLAASVFAGILFGLAPALKVSKSDVQETLREGGRGASGARHRAQGMLVVVEMALALVLLIGAGLLVRSLSALWSVDPGFRPDNVLTFGISMPPAMIKANPDAIRSMGREIQEHLAATPGVQAISYIWGAFPLRGDDEALFWMDGQPKPKNVFEMNWALKYVVGPEYLQAMGIVLERGRFFTTRDDEHAPPVIVIDDALAKKFFGSEDPVGKRLNMEDYDTPAEIIGVVRHVKQWSLDADEKNELQAQVYQAFAQLSDGSVKGIPSGVGVVVHSAGVAPGLLDSIRQVNTRMCKEQVISGPQTMDELIAVSIATKRFSMILLGTFAIVALVLASIGLYGVISYLVGQRTHEIGVRIALGAQGGDVVRWVLGQGARMAVGGVAIGLVASAGLTRLLAKESLLFGVSATDPLTFAGVAIGLTVVAMAACWIPARRAMRVDPIIALRYE
ncbi:MAG TPA: ABC transporter permease [Candidatus Acidoferrum sp.]|nr:ABC transporter permease [Candidatus Acidoferrum sp.]